MNNTYPNDPNIDSTYNYVYKITNNINGKIYIGVHRTNNLDDGYMGSGRVIKRAIKKNGVDNFTKEILQFFDTYKEALDLEREIVNLEFIEENTNYNLKEGGYGNCGWSSEMLQILSESSKKRWENPEYRAMMKSALNTDERKEKLSKGIKNWINENPEKHMERMLKINKNPDKINKMAESHRGMKRTSESKKKMSDSLLNFHKENPEDSKRISGIGCKYIYNPETDISKRIYDDEDMPEGWIKGTGPKRNKQSYLNLNKGSAFAYCPITGKCNRFKTKELVPVGYILGRIVNK